jgi:hypothetical protein
MAEEAKEEVKEMMESAMEEAKEEVKDMDKAMEDVGSAMEVLSAGAEKIAEAVKEGGKDLDSAMKALSTSAGSYDRWNLKEESTIDYGALGSTKGADIAEKGEGFYITTAINYTNGPAHMGHAYEAATTDVIARFQRLKGTQSAYFVTGADEHGQKIANTAEEEGKEPIEICNEVRNYTH